MKIKTSYRKTDKSKWTKTGKRRKGGIVCTPEREQLKLAFWFKVKTELQEHFKVYGNAVRMARTIGISPVMLHHYACPVCEHDTEPSFSIGMAIMLYLSEYKWKASSLDASNPFPVGSPRAAYLNQRARQLNPSEYQAIPCLVLLNRVLCYA